MIGKINKQKSGCFLVLEKFSTAEINSDVLEKVLGVDIQKESSSYTYSEFGPIRVIADLSRSLSLVLEPNRMRFEIDGGAELTKDLMEMYLFKFLNYIQKEQGSTIKSFQFLEILGIHMEKRAQSVLLGTAFKGKGFDLEAYGAGIKSDAEEFYVDIHLSQPDVTKKDLVATFNISYKEDYQNKEDFCKKYRESLEYINHTIHKLLK